MWYRFAAPPFKPLMNPVVGGFWVEKENELGDIELIPVEYGRGFSKYYWQKLLNTNKRNLASQETLDKFLDNPQRFRLDENGKYIFIKDTSYKTKNLIIPFDFDVYDDEKEEYITIEKDEVFNQAKLTKLLNTHVTNLASQETFDNFLKNSQRFNISENGKYIYVKNPRGSAKNLIIPFDFDVYDDESRTYTTIKKGKVFKQNELKKLLNTSVTNLVSQETFDNFLKNSQRFQLDENGKYIYVKNLKNIDKNLIIPFTFDVYDDEKEEYITIEKDEVFSQNKLIKLLNTSFTNLDSQETFDNFLKNSQRFQLDENGKYIYVKNPRGSAKNLIIPFTFDVYDDESQKYITIEKDEVFNQAKLRKLLHTKHKNLASQETLDKFLKNPRRFQLDENGNLRYKSISISIRESLFEQKFNNYNRDSITIQNQQKIIISYKINNVIKNTILKLDFAFIKNNKTILAIEINGEQHYGFVDFSTNKSRTYDTWQQSLNRDILKINYCHNNNIPLLIFNHMLSDKDFETILNNLYQNPHVYDNFIPPSVIDENVNNTSIEFVRRQIYSHLYPVFNGIISFANDEDKKKYIKDTLILISKLMGIYEGGIDKTDYIRAFDTNVDLTSNYNICLSIYNSLYPDFSLDKDEKITYSDLSKVPKIKKPTQLEEDITFEEE